MKTKLFLLPVIMAIVITNLFAEMGFRLLATIRGESPGNAFSEVCGLGDINQDDNDDFAIRAWKGKNSGNLIRILEMKCFGKGKIKTIFD